MKSSELHIDVTHERVLAADNTASVATFGMVDKLEMQIFLAGHLSEDQRNRLFEIANLCPTHRMLTSNVKIQSRLFVPDGPSQQAGTRQDNGIVQNALDGSCSASDVFQAAEKSDAARVDLTRQWKDLGCSTDFPNCYHVQQFSAFHRSGSSVCTNCGVASLSAGTEEQIRIADRMPPNVVSSA